MRIKLPQLEDDILEVELPSSDILFLKLKTITAEQASKNAQAVRELDRERLSGELSYLQYTFSVLDMGLANLTSELKEQLSQLPDEYLAAIMQKLADLRFERIDRLKKNISQSLS